MAYRRVLQTRSAGPLKYASISGGSFLASEVCLPSQMPVFLPRDYEQGFLKTMEIALQST
jgi:hypothetical protein